VLAHFEKWIIHEMKTQLLGSQPKSHIYHQFYSYMMLDSLSSLDAFLLGSLARPSLPLGQSKELPDFLKKVYFGDIHPGQRNLYKVLTRLLIGSSRF
jgi:hypothetical protein